MGDLLVCAAVAVRSAIGVVFAVAAVSKTRPRGRADFRAAVAALAPAADGGARVLAVAVITAEWAVAVLVVLPGQAPATAAAGLVAAAVLLAAFTAAIYLALRRGTTTPCRCFAASARPISRVQILRGTLLLSACAVGLAAQAQAVGPARPAGLWVAAVTGVLLGAAAVAFDDLADLFTTPAAPALTTPAQTTPDTPAPSAAPVGAAPVGAGRGTRQEHPRR